MSFNYSPKIVTNGLVFYTDPFNFKSRSRSLGSTGGTITDLTSSYGFGGDFQNFGPQISDNYKYMTFNGTDDFILFPANSSEESQVQQPFPRTKPKTFTLSAWVKSGTTGGGGVMFWGGGNDYFLKIPALTATTYSAGTYTGVIGENWSATTVAQAALNLPTFEVTVDSGGTITKAVAETTIGFGTSPINENVIVRISGDTIGGTTPADDAYLFWRSGTSSQMRWGFSVGNSYSVTIGDSIDKGTFTTDRVSNQPQEWNLITITDVGELVTNNLSCYVNGELVNTGTGTFLNGSQMNPGTMNAGQINIGKGNPSSFSTFLDGSLGPCMAYDRALTPNEVLRNYEALKNRFGPIKEPNFNTKSILLDGTDDYVELNSPTSIQSLTSQITISFWIKAPRIFSTNYYTPLSKGEYAAVGSQWSIQVNTANLRNTVGGTFTTFSAADAISGRQNLNFITPVDDNQWHHMMFVNDGTDLKIYLDGQLEATGVGQGGTLYDGNRSLKLGKLTNTSSTGLLQGNLDEVAIFSTALGLSDAQTIYNNGVPNDISSLSPVSWWRCGDGDTVPILIDNGSGGNNGTMVNFNKFSIDVPT